MSNPLNRPYDPETGEPSDVDQNNPVEMSQEDWAEFYANNPDYNIDNDHSMDY